MVAQTFSAPTPVNLTERTLQQIDSNGYVSAPQYNRGSVQPGIMHFGVGNFFRAHQAVFVDDLMNRGQDLDWGIVGANVIPQAEGGRALMTAQDNLSMVVEQGATDSRARVLGCLIDYMGSAQIEAMISRLTDPKIRIVSLTITEGGYILDPDTGGFDQRHPVVLEEAANPERPKTTFGVIVAALKRRRDAGLQPFTVVSCDNILHNGVVTRNAVVGLGSMIDADLGRWIAETVAFPNGMVDRITPVTGEVERRRCVEEYGVKDDCPVFCERFRQWVLEDNFPAGRPRLEDAGVMFVQDVTPYENMKLRILNGGHMVVGLVGSLIGTRFVSEFMAHPLGRAFWRKVMEEEVVPSVPHVPGVDLYNYLDLIEERFANPKIEDTVQRLLLNVSDKIPKFIHPSVLARLERGDQCRGLSLISALWCRYCYEVSNDDARRLNDPAAQKLMKHARLATETDPRAWLAMDEIYSDPLMARGNAFVNAFTDSFTALQMGSNVQEVLTDYVNERGYFGTVFDMFKTPQDRQASVVVPRRCSIELVAQGIGRLLDGGVDALALNAATGGAIAEEDESGVVQQQQMNATNTSFALTA